MAMLIASLDTPLRRGRSLIRNPSTSRTRITLAHMARDTLASASNSIAKASSRRERRTGKGRDVGVSSRRSGGTARSA